MFVKPVVKYLFLFILLFFTSAALYAQNKPLTIMLDWALNPDHAPLFVGEYYGFFAKQGLSVALIPPSDPSDPEKFAAAGKVDLAIAYEPQWIELRQKGLPLVWVATLVGQPLMVIIANEKIKNLSALRGVSIGYSSGGTQKLLLQTVLRQSQLANHDVVLLNLHYNLLQALVSGRVMAITGAMRNVEPIELDQKHVPYHLFYLEDYGVPSFSELIFVTRADLKNDVRFKKFVIALQQAIVYLKARPEETWQAFAKENPSLNDATNHKIWLATAHYFDDTPGFFDQAQFEQFMKFLRSEQARDVRAI
jgi:putative hydroxymethylpyrimidine transport system substrate-binding protein